MRKFKSFTWVFLRINFQRQENDLPAKIFYKFSAITPITQYLLQRQTQDMKVRIKQRRQLFLYLIYKIKISNFNFLQIFRVFSSDTKIHFKLAETSTSVQIFIRRFKIQKLIH